MTERYELVCFDMAGTTLLDGGLVLEAFRRTIAALDVAGADAARMEAYVVQTMGQSKIEVFTALFDARGPLANERFEREFLAVVADVGVSEVPGAHDAVRALRSVSRVALTTGFAPSTRSALIDALGWQALFDVVVSPDDVGRGRPCPDMLLACVIRAGARSVDAMAVVGDTWSDMEAGRRAGAGLLVGVRTGTDGDERLKDGGAHVVIDSVADVPSLLGVAGR
jgi:phosphoglycolate phosphatase